MSGSLDNYGFIEIIFVAAVALGLGFWQLWSVNREIAKDKAERADKAAREGATETPGDAAHNRPPTTLD